MIYLGCTAFLLFFLSDYNDAFRRKKLPPFLFPAGALLLIFAIFCECITGTSPLAALNLRLGFYLLALGFLILEVYTLFFALPRKEAYAEPGKKRSVYRKGVYALCRHPGVLWFAGLCFCLCPAAGLSLLSAAVYTALDVLLVLYEDRLVFPRLMDGYEDYRSETPFLIPTRSSIRRSRES